MNLSLLWDVLTNPDAWREVIHDATRASKDDARDSARDVLVALLVKVPLMVFAGGGVAHWIWYWITR